MKYRHSTRAFAIVAFASLGVACGSDSDSKKKGGTGGTAGSGATGGGAGSAGAGGAGGAAGAGATGGAGGAGGSAGAGATGGAGGSSGAAGAGGSAGGATFSCTQIDGMGCIELAGAVAQLTDQLRSQCTQQGGTVGTGCSRSGASGVCTTSIGQAASRIVYYGLDADSVSAARQACESAGGMWSNT